MEERTSPGGAHPILSCAEAMAWEKKLLGGDETAEWAAMSCAGRSLGHAILDDSLEMGGIRAGAHLLVLCGKGHNGGDALIALRTILDEAHDRRCEATVLIVPGFAALRPLVRRALEELWQAHENRIEFVCTGRDAEAAVRAIDAGAFDVCLDGLFGMQFRPPLRALERRVLEVINAHEAIGMRVAVDMPSGVGDESDSGAFRADFSYATGIAKVPLFTSGNREKIGRIRYLDIGFFDGDGPGNVDRFVLTPAVLNPLRDLRPSQTDKRAFGHLFVVSGSRSMPGAVMMAVESALLSGAGLVTAFVPESLAATCACRLPEAMWVPMPETPDGGLALEGRGVVLAKAGRCTALLAGPGLGRERESLTLIAELLKVLDVSVVLDGDALQPEVIRAKRTTKAILTPHAGEFFRISERNDPGDFALLETAEKYGATIALKGAPTRVSDGKSIHIAPFGGPVLSRGGSGDVLAGLVGGLLAQGIVSFEAAARGVVWHGMTADSLARERGQGSARVTQLCDHLAEVLGELGGE